MWPPRPPTTTSGREVRLNWNLGVSFVHRKRKKIDMHLPPFLYAMFLLFIFHFFLCRLFIILRMFRSPCFSFIFFPFPCFPIPAAMHFFKDSKSRIWIMIFFLPVFSLILIFCFLFLFPFHFSVSPFSISSLLSGSLYLPVLFSLPFFILPPPPPILPPFHGRKFYLLRRRPAPSLTSTFSKPAFLFPLFCRTPGVQAVKGFQTDPESSWLGQSVRSIMLSGRLLIN